MQQGQQGPGGSWDSQNQSNQDEVKTLWVGDLQYWMDENYLWNALAHTQEVHTVKVIRNKATGQSEGYGFVEMTSHSAAERTLQTYNGTVMPQTEQPFRMNWASFGIGERRPEVGPEHSIFVGDLASDVSDYTLTETFRARFPSVKGAKVVTDSVTGRSKGYGFVRFGVEEERDRAMQEMNGEYCSSRPMRISIATPKKPLVPGGRGPAGVAQPGAGAFGPPPPADADPSNTTVFVGGLDPAIGEEQLREVFSQYGPLIYVKIPFGKGCGFVQFQQRQSAEDALASLHGSIIGAQAVRLSWGRNPSSKQQRVGPPGGGWGQQPPPHDPNVWGQQQGYYQYGAGGYDQQAYGYGYEGHPPVDPTYGGYGAYQQPPPQHMPPPQHGGYIQQGEGQGGHTPVVLAGEQRVEPLYDPRAVPDVDSMNAAYIGVTEPGLAAQPHVWFSSSNPPVTT